MRIWQFILGWYLLMSLVAFAAYWLDKRAAAAGRRRVRERTLHAMELLGGWPGALVGQRTLRHKTRDHRFLAVFVMIVGTHIAGWGAYWWLTRG